MPQMFPMPFTLLMIMVSIILLFVIMRLFWSVITSDNLIMSGEKTTQNSSSNFYQQIW